MRRIYAYFISLQLLFSVSISGLFAQDTIPVALKLRLGLEVSGPVKYLINPDILNTEGFIAVDLNEKITASLAAGYLKYHYSQYNYDYNVDGIFFRAGADFNILKINKTKGKYYGGIGLKYGLSQYTYEVPSFYSENYWGRAESSIPSLSGWGHFLEFAPGVRADLFRNVSIGWTINIRMLLYNTSPDDIKPIYLPGFGDTGKIFSANMSYFISFAIPYKRITVITKKEVAEEAPEPETKQSNR
jgi:hypothetical protein